jgi:hypothetical protein
LELNIGRRLETINLGSGRRNEGETVAVVVIVRGETKVGVTTRLSFAGIGDRRGSSRVALELIRLRGVSDQRFNNEIRVLNVLTGSSV